VGFSAYTSSGAYRTFEMDADALNGIGLSGFVSDAQAMPKAPNPWRHDLKCFHDPGASA
jgi:hypothetical protein